ncbi:MAG: condensation domain-containing protein, partial [Bryobacteraceae bacterium]
SDVPRAGLSQQSLDDLLTRLDPENVEDIYQLSAMQQGMLFHSMLENNSTSYFEQITCSFRADSETGLDGDRFRAAWQRVVDRHAILRTSFHWSGLEHPVQVVAKHSELAWRDIDWTGLSPNDQQIEFARFLKQDRQQGLDLPAGPPMRCTLIRTGAAGFRFCWSHHHALLDGWSAGLVLQEVFDAYGGALADAAPAPYRRYIDWLSVQDHAVGERFWRRELDGFEAPTPLAGSPARDSTGGFGVEQVDLSSALSDALRARAQQQRLTVNTLFIAAWSLLLSRYSGSHDVLFGLTVAGRPPLLPGIESMVGLFINTLPARVRIDHERQVSAWLAGIHWCSATWIEHGHVALVDIRDWTDIARDTPLFDSILVFEDYPADRSAEQ